MTTLPDGLTLAGERLRKVSTFAVRLLEAHDLDDLLWGIAQEAGETLGFEDCVVYLREEDVLVQVAAYGIKSTAEREIFQRIALPVGRGIVGSVAASGKAELIADTSLDARYVADQFPGRSELTVPVVFEGRVIGVLDSEASRPGAYGPDDLELFQTLANIAAPRIAGALTTRELLRTREALWQANERLERRVTERTREVEEEKERFRLTLRSIADGVVATDRQGVVTYLNPAAEALLGTASGEAEGMDVDALYRPVPVDGGTFLPFGQRTALVGTGGSVPELLLERVGHPKRRVLEEITPLGSGEAKGYVIVLRDITERRRVEEELRRSQRLESLGVLAGGIAHDFNNLLTAIMGNLDLVQEIARATDPEVRMALERAWMACEQATHLPRQLISLSRGGDAVRETDVDVGQVVRSAVERIVTPPVTADVSLAPDLLAREADPSQLGQVFENLLRNAQEALGSGGTIWVEGWVEAGAAGPVVVVEVRDDGPGVADDLRDVLFDPFVTTKPSASGLGLTTAHAIMRRHGGGLEYIRDARDETVFRVTLLGSSTASPGAGVREREKDEESDGQDSSLRVLVMDDERPIRMLLERALTRAGHRVACVTNRAEAEAACRAAVDDDDRFQVAILDVNVPDGGGSRALKTLREIDPGVRAVVATGNSADAVSMDPEAHGFQAALPKPFGIAAVVEAVERAAR